MNWKKPLLTLALLAFATSAQAEKQKLHYDLYWSGITVGEMDLFIEEDGKNYEYTANIETKGILGYFIKYISSNTSKGILKNNHPIPQFYNSDWTRKKHSQNLKITYKNNKVDEVVRTPKNRKKHPDVPEEMLKNTFDPVSAAFKTREKIREAMKNGVQLPAKIITKVYDAKRLFDAEVYIQGYETKNIGGKKQKLLHIILKRTPIAGFRANKLKEMLEGEGDPDIEIFLNDDYLPVWGFGEAELGTATIKLDI